MPRFSRLFVLALCLGALLFPAGPARAADETLQVMMLKKLFASPMLDWQRILEENRHILDASYFDRVERRIRWSLDNGQVEDAVRFAIVGDMSAKAAGRKTDYRLEMARLFLRLGNMQMCMDLIDNILVMEPQNQPVRFFKASVVHDGGNLVDSYFLYDALAKEGYRKPECLYRMAVIELRREDQALARQHLEEAIRLDPKHTLARQELDRLLRGLASEHIVPTDGGPTGTNPPPFSGATSNLTPEQKGRAAGFFADAETAREQGDLTRAADLFNQAIQTDPTLVKAHVYLGAIYFQTRNLEPAIRSLERASQIDPKDAEAWRYLGYCYERRYDTSRESGDLARAQDAFTKAGALDPTNELLKMDLQRIQDKAGAAPAASR